MNEIQTLIFGDVVNVTRSVAVSIALLMAACTAHRQSSTKHDDGFIADIRADFELLTMSDEERRAFEDRARLRELQRKHGLRVCEEGEHGTTWVEDCKTCRCVNGLRSCPAVKCKKASDADYPIPPNRRPLVLDEPPPPRTSTADRARGEDR